MIRMIEMLDMMEENENKKCRPRENRKENRKLMVFLLNLFRLCSVSRSQQLLCQYPPMEMPCRTYNIGAL